MGYPKFGWRIIRYLVQNKSNLVSSKVYGIGKMNDGIFYERNEFFSFDIVNNLWITNWEKFPFELFKIGRPGKISKALR